jgi:hypothetical protein
MLALNGSVAYNVCLRFEVVMVVTVKITVFKDVVPCSAIIGILSFLGLASFSLPLSCNLYLFILLSSASFVSCTLCCGSASVNV